MQCDRSQAIDFSQENSPNRILVESPVLTSYEVGWDTIHFLYHRQPAHETPECQFKQHRHLLQMSRRRDLSRLYKGFWVTHN